MRKNPRGINALLRPSSACESAQADQDLHSPSIGSPAIEDYIEQYKEKDLMVEAELPAILRLR